MWRSKIIVNTEIAKLLSRFERIRILFIVLGIAGLAYFFCFTFLGIWQGQVAGGVLFAVGVLSFAVLEVFVRQSIEKFDGVLSRILQNEVVYLHSEIFEGLDNSQRLLFVKRLVISPNLNSFELIGELAIAKKVLHISEERLQSLLKAKNLGLISEINNNQLRILESDKMIKPGELQRAKSTVNFAQEDSLLRMAQNPYFRHDESKVQKIKNALGGFMIALIVLGVAMMVVGAVGYVILEEEFLILLFSGGIVFFSPLLLIHKWLAIGKLKERAKAIIDKVNEKEIVSISDDCFAGLSAAKRQNIIKTMIKSGVVNDRILFEGIAVADKKYADKYDEVLRLVTGSNVKKSDTKRVKTIKVEIVTNCPSCGAVYREGVAFCTSCGTAKVL